MGMFDYYKPEPELNCPICQTVLDDWQGKDANCGLFIWKQGIAFPIAQDACDLNIEEEKRMKLRLPEKFQIYTNCINCKNLWIHAVCKTKNDIWTETKIIDAKKLKSMI